MKPKRSSFHSVGYCSLLLLLGVLSFSSCGHYFYAPTESGLLELREGGDLKIGGALGGGWQSDDSKRRSFSGQLAYSPIRSIGIQAGGTLWRDHRVVFEEDYWTGATNSKFIDLALGHYWTINKNHATAEDGLKFIWDNYVGFGSGNIEHLQELGAGYDLGLHKYFLQSHLSVSINNRFSFGIFVRPTWINYHSANVYGALPSHMVGNIEYLGSIPYPLFIESGFDIQGGWEKVKFFLTSRFRVNQSNSGRMINDFSRIPDIPLNASLGFVFDIDDLLWNKASKKHKRQVH